MGFNIITEENHRDILEKLAELTKNKIYTYSYGVYKKCTNIADIIQKKDNLEYEMQKPHIWITYSGRIFEDKLCGVVSSNADIIEVEEHRLYRDYLKLKNSQEFVSNQSQYINWWTLTKPLIHLSLHNDQVLSLCEGDAIEIIGNDFKILAKEPYVSINYIELYEFRYVMTITDEESASLRVSKELYIEEANDYYNEFTMNDMLCEDCSNSEVDDELCELYDPTDDCK